MSEQATLPLECGPRLTRREKFLAFKRDHPEVERELVRLARRAIFQGKRVGMRCLWEVARWNLWLQHDSSDWKMNNDHAPYFARHLMRTYPDLAGLFETRGDK